MKTAMVREHKTGYWIVLDSDTFQQIGALHKTELDAYKAANSDGYLVI